uniref:Alkylated DNA repair dioxygenase n=1 Tax=Pithovirus LCPAC406 TaxID=2506599 RepID=A0A481ZGI5_9VIRU|nr:MAG: alkylated DNA repair dioxygenase [Pithovirus LCPAC406]
MQCEGITKKGKRCKLKVKTGKFCRHHSEEKQSPELFDGTQKIEGLGTGDSLYIPNFIDKPDEIFKLLQNELEYFPREDVRFKIFNKVHTFQRDIVFHSDVEEDGIRPLFRYRLINQPESIQWTQTSELIRDAVKTKFNQLCNTAIVNRYRRNKDYIGPHHDKTGDLVPKSLIFSVSFGAVREFSLQSENKKQRIMLGSGSILVLGPETNKTFKHSVTKSKGEDSERISITLRSVKTFIDKKGKIFTRN